jgi:hypothetical protein
VNDIERIPVAEMVARTGVSDRQFRYWYRSGLVAVEGVPGSGHKHFVPLSEEPFLVLMGKLVGGGMLPTAAAPLARTLVRDGRATFAGLEIRVHTQ